MRTPPNFLEPDPCSCRQSIHSRVKPGANLRPVIGGQNAMKVQEYQLKLSTASRAEMVNGDLYELRHSCQQCKLMCILRKEHLAGY